jgi:hypothetical protein
MQNQSIKIQNIQRKPPTCRKSLTDYHIILYQVHLAWAGFELTILVVIDTDCIGSYKPNYHTITATTAPSPDLGLPLRLHFGQLPCNGWLVNKFSQHPNSSSILSINLHKVDNRSTGGRRFVCVLLPWFAENKITLCFVNVELTILVVIDTDCIGSYKPNYHTITATTAPLFI